MVRGDSPLRKGQGNILSIQRDPTDETPSSTLWALLNTMVLTYFFAYAALEWIVLIPSVFFILIFLQITAQMPALCAWPEAHRSQGKNASRIRATRHVLQRTRLYATPHGVISIFFFNISLLAQTRLTSKGAGHTKEMKAHRNSQYSCTSMHFQG